MTAGWPRALDRAADAPAAFDAARVRADFPILRRRVHGKPLVYLDNAATTHKPRVVIDAVAHHYERDNANVHRSIHALGEQATGAYERARRTVRDFLGAADEREVVFTRGTTESINLVAASFGGSRLGPGDEVLVSAMEHHANIVPWQLACRATGAALRVAPVNDRGELDRGALARLIGPRTRIVAVAHVSNALGTLNPVAEVAELAHRHGAVILVDGALAVAHLPIDVRALDCDFYAFSGHKVFAPTGIGVLWGRAELLDAMPPWQGGGEMILSVSFETTTYNALPYKFEAGTPPIAGAVGLGAALGYLAALDAGARAAHEDDLLAYAEESLRAVPGLRLVGTAAHKVGVHSFVMAGVHPHDIGTILDHEGVAIRTGHHCAQPLMARLGLPATARASFAIYNTRADVDRLIDGLGAVRTVLGRCLT